MSGKVLLYNPQDSQGQVRGVGRYIQLLKEALPELESYEIGSYSDDAILLNPFYNIIQSDQLTKRVARKQIALIHDLIPLKYPNHFPIGIKAKLDVFKNKRALKNYDAVVTDSETSKKDIVKMLQIDEKRVHVIYPTLTRSFSQQPSKDPLNLPFQLPPKYCVYVGDATWNKNLVFMAKAIKAANVTCVVVGKVFVHNQSLDHPWQKELRDFFLETKGDKRFLFTGFISDNDLIKLYTQSRLNILLSRDEGFGFSFLEAASLRVPSVLSATPIFRETALDSALFSSISDPTEAANRIEELYFDDYKQQIMASKALDRSKIYTKQLFVTKWRSLLFS